MPSLPANAERLGRSLRIALRGMTGAWKAFRPLWVVLSLIACALIVIGASSSIWVTVGGIAVFVIPIAITFDIERRKALRARYSVLRPLNSQSADTSTIFFGSLSDGASSDSPFYSRSEIGRLNALFGDSKKLLLILEGGPLVGKTRLAKKWAADLESGWVVGWLRMGCGKEAVDAVAACGEDTLILIDGYSSDLQELTDRLMDYEPSKIQPRIRLLVVVRDAAVLRRSLSGEGADMLARAPVVHLGPIGQAADHRRWFDELVRYYARVLGTPVPRSDYRHIPRMKAMPIGLFHLAALSAVCMSLKPTAKGPSLPSGTLGVEDLLKILWARETELLNKQRLSPEWGIPAVGNYHLEAAAVALSLLELPDAQSCLDVLELIPELREMPPADRRNIVGFLHHSFPSPDLTCSQHVCIKPELIACAVLAPFVSDGLLGHEFVQKLDPAVANELVRKVVRWASLLPSAAAALEELVGTNVGRVRRAIEGAVFDGNGSPGLDEVIARVIPSCNLSPETADELRFLIPATTLPKTELALCEVQLTGLLLLVESGHREQEPLLSARLSEKARLLLHGTNARHEALRISAEAVAVSNRFLAAEEPALKALRGQILVTHCLCLRSALQLPAALQCINEAVEIFRALSGAETAEYRLALSDALMVQSTCLSTSGATQDAFEAVSEAVEIIRSLEGSHQGQLAFALVGQATYMQEMPDRVLEAQRIIAEAEAIYRLLWVESPAAYEPELAGTLLTQAQILRKREGHQHQAIAAINEAVRIYERLALEDKTRHEPALGGALLAQVAVLASGGANRSQALSASKRSVEIFYRLVATEPSHEGTLADALMNYSNSLAEYGKDANSVLAPLQEALAIYQRLSTVVGGRYVPRLVSALATKASVLAFQANEAKGGLAAIDEALRTYEGHSKSEVLGLRKEETWAEMLSQKARILMLLGDHKQAVTVTKNALAVVEELADKDKAAWSMQLKRQRLILRRLLDETGETASSITEGLTP